MKFIRAFMYGLEAGDNIKVVVDGIEHTFTPETVQQDIVVVPDPEPIPDHASALTGDGNA